MKRVLKRLFSILALLAIAAIMLLVVVSPKTTPPIVDSLGNQIEGSIALIEDIKLNGVSQRILIRGRDRTNPILLHVHGGPGGPDQAILQAQGFDLEQHFTVIYWDQRGAGASYHKQLDPETINLNQIVADGTALAQYLLQRFEQEKLFLQGHSWGTLVSTLMASQQPELFYAYIGIGQVANAKKAEQLSWEHTMARATESGDQDTINRLNEIGKPPYSDPQQWLNAVLVERALMRPYEMPDGSELISMLDTYRTFAFYRGYTLLEKLNSLEASDVSLQKMWLEVINTDLIASHKNFQLPIYILQGKYDQHTVTSVAREYFDVISAPYKEYHEFENSAHFPHLQEHSRYQDLLIEIKQQSMPQSITQSMPQ